MQGDLHRKAAGYLSLLTGRTASYALLMLRAHAARKRRSREARALYGLNLRRRALLAWRQSMVALRVLESGLLRVLHKARELHTIDACF